MTLQQFDYRAPEYRVARDAAFARSNGICQLCGHRAAEDAHHWAGGAIDGREIPYPDAKLSDPNDLVALCRICHAVATSIRRFYRRGGSPFRLRNRVQEVIDLCDTE